MVDEQQLLDLYELRATPFADRALDPIDPDIRDDVRLYAEVEGFGEHVELIKKWFTSSNNLRGPVRLLIYGPKGCGRSSVAHFILHEFNATLQANQRAVHRINVQIKNDSKHKWTLKALDDLFTDLKRKGETFTSPFAQPLAARYDQDVRRSPNSDNALIYRGLFQDTLPLLDEAYRRATAQEPPDRQLLGCQTVVEVDNALNWEQTDFALSAFEEAPLLLVTTSQSEVIEPLKEGLVKSELNGFFVELHELSLEQVKMFLDARWAYLTNNKRRHPFPNGGLETVFAAKRTWSFLVVTRVFKEVFAAHFKALMQSPLPLAAPDLDDAFMGPQAVAQMVRLGYVSVDGNGP